MPVYVWIPLAILGVIIFTAWIGISVGRDF